MQVELPFPRDWTARWAVQQLGILRTGKIRRKRRQLIHISSSPDGTQPCAGASLHEELGELILPALQSEAD